MKAIIVRHGSTISGFEHKSEVGHYDRNSSRSTQLIADKILRGRLGQHKLTHDVLKWLRSGKTGLLHKLNFDDVLCDDIYLQIVED